MNALKRAATAAAAVLLMGATASLIAPAALAQDTTRLIYTTGWPPPPDLNAQLAEKWAELVQEKTGGRIEVRRIYGGALLAAKEVLDGVSKKQADVGGWYPGWDPGKVPLMHSLVTLVDLESGAQLDAAGQLLVATKLFEEFPQFNAELERAGVKLLHMAPTASYTLLFKEPVESLAGLNGRKLRSLPAFEALFKAIGMTPVTMDPGDVYTSLGTGLVDGAMAAINYFPTSSWWEVAPYHFYPSVTGNGPWSALPATYAIISLETWNSLPPDIQAIIEEVDKEMAGYAVQLSQDQADASGAKVEELTGKPGYHLTQAEFDEWVAAAPDAWAAVEQRMNENGAPGAEIIARYKELVGEYKAGMLKPWW